MSQQTCPCGQPTAGATLCANCHQTLEIALANIAAYYAELDTVRAKQTRYGTGSPSGIGREIPLPLDDRFTDPDHDHWRIQADTQNTLTTWARIVLDETPTVHGPACARPCLHVSCATARRNQDKPTDHPASCCRYLTRHLNRITGAPYADELLDELTDLEHRLQRIIDRPADRWYAGICSTPTDDDTCTAELYARTDHGAIKCPDCGTSHDIATRREFLLNEAEHMLVTATEAARAVVVWSDYGRGETRLVNRISTWRDRNRIEVRGRITELGVDRPLYRLGDVLDLLAEDATRDTRTVDKSA